VSTAERLPGPAPGASEPPRPERHPLLAALSLFTRGLMLVAIVAVFITAAVLIGYAAWQVWELVRELFSGHEIDAEHMMLEAIELVDMFLLATVLDVVAIGLYQLYIDSRVPVPPWLRINSIDDLKAKLIGVVITMLGVVFVGRALSWDGSDGLIYFGGAVAAVVAALTFFLTIHLRDEEHD